MATDFSSPRMPELVAQCRATLRQTEEVMAQVRHELNDRYRFMRELANQMAASQAALARSTDKLRS
jgi:hypothetical protein